jgi:K+-sensing histidine kinase KdpD
MSSGLHGAPAPPEHASSELLDRQFSHDVRNALSTIECCTAVLLAPEPASDDTVRHAAEVIQRSAAWLQQIVAERVDASPTADALARSTSPTRFP